VGFTPTSHGRRGKRQVVCRIAECFSETGRFAEGSAEQRDEYTEIGAMLPQALYIA
jgi:hypothetical protein